MKINLTFILPLFFIVIGCRQDKQTENLKFNREEWLQGDIRTRGKMVENIIDDNILINKSKSEVLSLLGDQGDTTGNFSYQVDIGKTTGPFGWGGIWPFALNIHFDTLSSKVIEVRCND
ncbi:MAG: hypothetical protein IPK88_09330 [Saprospiraceae bacterium]|nr:hypothetical protein [Candidatus Defluviibacterium haderslevense]